MTEGDESVFQLLGPGVCVAAVSQQAVGGSAGGRPSAPGVCPRGGRPRCGRGRERGSLPSRWGGHVQGMRWAGCGGQDAGGKVGMPATGRGLAWEARLQSPPRIKERGPGIKRKPLLAE